MESTPLGLLVCTRIFEAAASRIPLQCFCGYARQSQGVAIKSFTYLSLFRSTAPRPSLPCPPSLRHLTGSVQVWIRGVSARYINRPYDQSASFVVGSLVVDDLLQQEAVAAALAPAGSSAGGVGRALSTVPKLASSLSEDCPSEAAVREWAGLDASSSHASAVDSLMRSMQLSVPLGIAAAREAAALETKSDGLCVRSGGAAFPRTSQNMGRFAAPLAHFVRRRCHSVPRALFLPLKRV